MCSVQFALDINLVTKSCGPLFKYTLFTPYARPNIKPQITKKPEKQLNTS